MTQNKHRRFFYGYVVVTAMFFVMVVGWGSIYSFGVFLKPVLVDFGWTNAATSGAYSLYMFIHGLFYIVTGRLTDRFGPRAVLTVCGILLGLGYFLMSQVSLIWQIYLFYGVIIGISMSGFFVPIVSTVVRWFVERRGLMTSIVVAGVGAGTMVLPPLAGWLISNYGWRTCYVIVGTIVLLFAVSAAQFLRRDPAQMGQSPYGEPEPDANVPGLPSGLAGFSLSEAIRTSQFWVFTAILFCFGFSLQTVMVHIVTHAIELGNSAMISASIMTFIGGLSIAGRLIIGIGSDIIGNKRALVICLTFLPVALFGLMGAKELWMLYLFAAIFGFAYGGEVSLSSPIVAEVFGLKSHGIILGFILFLGATAGGAVGPLVAGRMFDITGNYYLAFLISAVVALMALALTSFLRPMSCKVKANGT